MKEKEDGEREVSKISPKYLMKFILYILQKIF